VIGTLATPDRRWRVEVISRDGQQSYRIVHADNVVEGLSLPDVQDVLRRAGVDLAELAPDRGVA
jgi:bifunctional non-homologous end joining protein LigD